MKKFKIISYLTVVALSFAVSLFGLGNVAEAKKSIVLSPTSQKIVLIPGETYKGSIRLSNPVTSDEDLNYAVSIGSFYTLGLAGGKDDYGDSDITTVTEYNEIMNWIKLNNTDGVVKPDEEITLSFDIVVPKDASAGGQYATILVRSIPGESETSTSGNSLGISESFQMASVIYAEVAGETREIGAITSNDIPSFLTTNTLEATSMVRNNGNVHTDAEYTLQVWPMFSDEEYCTNEENVSSTIVMPNTERYHVESCTLPSVGLFRAKQTVKIFGEVSTVEKTIIVCPIWLMVLLLVVIAAIIVWIVIAVRKHHKKAD